MDIKVFLNIHHRENKKTCFSVPSNITDGILFQILFLYTKSKIFVLGLWYVFNMSASFYMPMIHYIILYIHYNGGIFPLRIVSGLSCRRRYAIPLSY